jgi:glycosyltransferase involved in cell wall biosynthesis
MKERWIALLGRCDKPTDAVQDYCKFLGEALADHGIELRLERLEWNAASWATAQREVRRRAEAWRGEWVLVQYTALAWSARAFPLRFLRILKGLRERGVRVAVVYHDVEAYEGGRLVDRVRRAAQLRTMRQARHTADLAVLTVPEEKISWLRGGATGKTAFIPVGANLPASQAVPGLKVSRDGAPTVAVFGVTGGEAGRREAEEIAAAIRFAAARVARLRLVVLGRHSEDDEKQLHDSLRDVAAEISVLGIRTGEEVVRTLIAADVLLFVRSPISSRRGSAIAGIACGLPVIARAGSETAPPVTDAGVVFYSRDEKDQLGKILAHVLEDDSYRMMLAEKSRRAYEEHFSWSAIAKKYVEALRGGS